MIYNTQARFEFAANGAGSYDPVTHKHTASVRPAETRTVNMTTMSESRAYNEYGVTDLSLIKIRAFDVLPTGFARVVVAGVTYTQYDRQQVGSTTTLTLQEVLK